MTAPSSRCHERAPEAGAEFDSVILANAFGFADALSGAAVAGDETAPVLLTGPDGLDDRVAAFLATLDADTEILAVGGESVLSQAVLDDVVALGFTVERLAGDSRYGTAVEIAEARFPSPNSVVVTTGKNFPDALAGAALAGRRSVPITLVGTQLPDEVTDYLKANADSIDSVYVFGGQGAVPQAPPLPTDGQGRMQHRPWPSTTQPHPECLKKPPACPWCRCRMPLPIGQEVGAWRASESISPGRFSA